MIRFIWRRVRSRKKKHETIVSLPRATTSILRRVERRNELKTCNKRAQDNIVRNNKKKKRVKIQLHGEEIKHRIMSIYIYIYVRMCVCVCTPRPCEQTYFAIFSIIMASRFRCSRFRHKPWTYKQPRKSYNLFYEIITVKIHHIIFYT